MAPNTDGQNSCLEEGTNAKRRVWVITGTSSGLGRALVEEALARGDCVVATARSLDSIRHFTSNPETSARIYTMCLDVTAPFADLRALADEAVGKWGRVDVLVNNAGVGMLGISEEVGEPGYQKQFATNFFGPMNVTYAFLPYMRARREGTIVFVGSRSSWRANLPMYGTYAASKAALTAAAEALSAEVAHLNIRVLNILPGGLRTENWNNMTLLPTAPEALLPPLGPLSRNGVDLDQGHGRAGETEKKTERSESKFDLSTGTGGKGMTSPESHIPDYVSLRASQIAWMRSITTPGSATKCAAGIIDVVTGTSIDSQGRKRGWPAMGLLVMGEDAEANIREKCEVVVKSLDEWRDVVRGIKLDE